MAGREQYIYDPVRLDTPGNMIDRIDIENRIDAGYGPGINGETASPFDFTDLQPVAEIRMQQRQRLDCEVIRDYPFEIGDKIQISEYVNSAAHRITDAISLPRDSKKLWKCLNLVRLDCQYSESNKILFRSVNGFHSVVEALSHHFYSDGRPKNNVLNQDIVNSCREMVKLAEITGFSAEDAVSITNSQFCAEGFCGILRLVCFRGRYKKDKERIVRIIHSMFKNPRLDHLGIFFQVINSFMIDPLAHSVELILCADIAYAYCNQQFHDLAVTALYSTLKTLIDRFYDSDETNADRIRVYEEYSDRSAALEKVLKVLCQLFARYSGNVVNILIWTGENPVVRQAIRILKYSLLHRQSRDDSFNGKHLLYALLINKYIYESFGEEGASREDIKVVFAFARSPVPRLYLFGGRPKLKDLAKQVVDKLLDCQAAGHVRTL